MIPILQDVAAAYLAAGAAIAAAFLSFGLGRVDRSARGAVAFRPLLVPGILLIWPIVLLRWRALAKGEDESRRHLPPRRGQTAAQVAMAVVLPVVFFGALLLQRDGPVEAPAILLAAPPEPGR